jgi:AcrR family transcriptional regulator
MEQYQEMQAKIKAEAWRLMAEMGAAGITLREIARRLAVTAPAIYNYYPTTFDLFTTLIVDAFHELAAALLQATQTATNPSSQLRAMLWAYRDWALANPTKYYLIYGTPIPGYHAPREITVPAAVGVFAALTQTLEAALQSGELIPRVPYEQVPTEQAELLAALITENQYPVTPLAVYLGFLVWGELYKLVMPSLLGHYTPLDTTALFEAEITHLLQRIGFST